MAAPIAISGQITGGNGLGLNGVTVELGTISGSSFTRTGNLNTTTDTDGNYSFGSVPVGEYKMRLTAPQSAGYKVAYYRDSADATSDPASATTISVTSADTTPRSVSERLVERPSVSGFVIGADDKALPGVTLAVGTVTAGTWAAVDGVSTTTTAADGTYTLTAVPNGTFVLKLTSAAYRDAYLVRNGTASTDASQGTSVVVNGADVTGANTKLAAKKAKVSGTVTGPDDAALSGVAVELGTVSGTTFTRSPAVPAVTSAADGTYTLPAVPDGNYKIRFSKTGFTTVLDDLVVSGTDVTKNASLASASTSPATIKGKVTDKSGTAISGAAVTLYKLTTAQGGTTWAAQPGPVNTGTDGTYSVTAPSAGTYRLGVTKSPYSDAFFKTATTTVRNVEDAGDIVVSGGDTSSGNDVKLLQPGSVSGQLVLADGSKYTGGGTISFWYSRTVRDAVTNTTSTHWVQQASTTISAVDGSFSRDLPADTYRVKADLAGFGMGFMPGMVGLDKATNVVVAAESTQAIPAYTLRTSILAGTVKDRLGRPLSPATVTARYTLVTDIVNGVPAAPEVFTVPAQADGSPASTDTGGRYFMRLLNRDSYSIGATGKIDGVDYTAYYPRTDSAAAATPVALSVDRSDVDIVGGDKLVLNTERPWVAGDAQDGETLTCNRGSYDPSDAILTVQWLKGGTAIDGATGLTYTIPLSASVPMGSQYACRVTATKAPNLTPAVITSKATGTSVSALSPAPGLQNRAEPVITGRPETGATLTVSNGQWSTPPTSYAYQWYADGLAISGATANTFVPGLAQRNAILTAKVTPNGSTTVSSTSAGTSRVTEGPVTNVTVPTIAGTMKTGEVVTATPGTWNPSTATFTYQWLADGAVISGATDKTFTPSLDQVGKRLSVAVTAAAPGYRSTTLESARSAEVTPAEAFTNTALPTITGTPTVGSTLVTSNGTWTPTPTSYAYQWSAGGTPIAGATTSSYTLTAAEKGKTVTVTVTAKKQGLLDKAATSAPTGTVTDGVVVSSDPTISGTAAIGRTLAVNPGTYSPSDATVTVQWLRDGAAITGATATTYTVTTADAGKKLSARVTYSKTGLTPATRTTAETAAVPAAGKVKPEITVTKKVVDGRLVLKVTVTASTQDPVTGDVRISEDGDALVTKSLNDNGKRKFVLRGVEKGFHSYQVAFLGNDAVKPRTRTVTINVR